MRRAIKSRQSQDWLPGVAGDPTSTGSRFWGPRLRKGARTGPLFHFRDGWREVPASGLLIILCDRVAVDIVRDRIAIDILRDRIAWTISEWTAMSLAVSPSNVAVPIWARGDASGEKEKSGRWGFRPLGAWGNGGYPIRNQFLCGCSDRPYSRSRV